MAETEAEAVAEGGSEVPLQRFRSLGLELVYRALGPPDGPPVVVLHGFGDHGRSFLPLAEALADRYRVIVPDQRGFGASGHVGPGGYYHFPDYVLDLDALFRAAKIERALVVGHSMGSAVGVYFAGAFPERLRGLVLIDSLGMPHEAAERAPARLRRFVEEVRGNEGLEGHTRRFDKLHMTHAAIPFDGPRFEAYLRAIGCPTLVIWGEDTNFRFPEQAQRMACLRAGRELQIAGSGHMVHRDQPAALAAAVRAFADDVHGA